MPNADILIRQAHPFEYEEAASLFLLSAPFFEDLGGEKQVQKIFACLFPKRGTLFSFEHTYLAEKDGTITGMALGYEWPQRKKEGLRTGLFLLASSGIHVFQHLRFFLNLNTVTGTFHPQGYYLSNLAVYPTYQGKSFGKQLLSFIEAIAYQRKLWCVELDVSAENHKAITIYHHLGYGVIRESRFSYRGRTLLFLRMRKIIQ
ncbi:MAG: GNAT family N-acetyltransferase [Atribacterota bacterium]